MPIAAEINEGLGTWAVHFSGPLHVAGLTAAAWSVVTALFAYDPGVVTVSGSTVSGEGMEVAGPGGTPGVTYDVPPGDLQAADLSPIAAFFFGV